MARKPKGPGGAPAFAWSEDIEDEIFRRIMGGEAVHAICGVNRDSFLPGEVTFYKRLANDSEFAKKYARAREAQAHREADEIRDIADAAKPDDYLVARLKIDARKWRASKMAPKVYGDKLELAGDPERPITTTIDPSQLSTKALRELMGALNDQAPDTDAG